MKTVLHIIEQLADFGGTPRKLLYLAAHNNDTATHLVFVTYLAPPPEATLEAKIRDYGATVLNLDTLSLLRLVRRIAAIARSTHADVICTHFTRPLLAGFLVSRWTGLPFIHNEHSSAHYRTGFGRRLAQLCLPFADAVICNSRHTAGTIATTYRIAPDHLHVLYNPVESRQVMQRREDVRAQLNFGFDDLVIGHVGGMIAMRDQATLLKAFCEILTRQRNARLVLIGDGPMRSALELLARRLGIVDSIRFIGYTEQVGDYLHAMDIYVNTTLDEGFGIAVVEAMLAGLPVVLSRAGAHPELVTDGQDGLLYNGGDVADLSRTLFTLIDQPGERQRLGAAAHASASDHFAPSRYAHDYSNLVDTITAHTRNGVTARASAD